MSEAEKFDNMSKAEKSKGVDQASIAGSDYSSASTFSKPWTQPPPYSTTRFITPSSLRAAVHSGLDEPAVPLIRLAIRLLQLAFALASGVSYAIELDHGYSASNANFIYAEVVFALTLLTILADIVIKRSYRFVCATEWTVTVLWIACFGIFYDVYLNGEVPADYAVVNFERMNFAGWCNLVNALLWFCSALFSTAMCCSGIKAALKGKTEKRRLSHEDKKAVNKVENMEAGTAAVEKL